MKIIEALEKSQSYHSCREKFNNPYIGIEQKFLSNCKNTFDKKEGYKSNKSLYNSLQDIKQRNEDKDEQVYNANNLNDFITVPICNSSINVPTGTHCIGGEMKQGARNRVFHPQFKKGGMLAYSGHVVM